jgi:NAD(P)-dependent dehydrogenase (short-subunit alcohol dehydrogenase family)
VQPDEIAALIEYLLSEKASAVTGANIPISGRV